VKGNYIPFLVFMTFFWFSFHLLGRKLFEVLEAICTLRGIGSYLYSARYWKLPVLCEVLEATCTLQGIGSQLYSTRYWMLPVFCKVLEATCTLQGIGSYLYSAR